VCKKFVVFQDGLPAVLFDGKVCPSGMTNDSKHSYRIFKKAEVRISYNPHYFILKIGYASDIIDDRKGSKVVEESVNGQISSEGIGQFCSVLIVSSEDAILNVCIVFEISFVGEVSESGYFNNLLVSKVNVSELKPSADNARVSKERSDLSGSSIGCDIKVFWFFFEQEISYSTADKVGFKVMPNESVHDFESIRIDIATRDAVLVTIIDDWLKGVGGGGVSFVLNRVFTHVQPGVFLL
jgi:hypothetical protein